jgi:hypothetical protein
LQLFAGNADATELKSEQGDNGHGKEISPERVRKKMRPNRGMRPNGGGENSFLVL